MCRLWLCWIMVVAYGILAVGAAAQSVATRSGQKLPRAKPPTFDPGRVERVFFDDVFRRTVGERPRGKPSAPADSGAAPESDDAAAISPALDAWSGLISAATLEDEIKALKLEVDKVVTTPGAFAASGYKEARIHFSHLALLFDVIAHYDGDVRWKSDAVAARQAFARVAANLKAGGSVQVYNESRKSKQDLEDLVGGARLPAPADVQASEQVEVARVPLMQLLEQRLEANLKKWTASESEFHAHADQLQHEAQLTAVIGRALCRPGAEDSEESEYQTFARLLEQGATNVVAAVKRMDPAEARNAVADISRSCVDCHENYR
ncbi:MAG: cytochrome c [Pirellulaceae bacterium]